MPSEQDHAAQARHNQEFYNSFDRALYEDWAATVLFYIGLHYIDAYLATISVHPGNHDRRDKCLREFATLRQVASSYWALKNSSLTARYYPPVTFPPNHVQQLEQTHLRHIMTQLQPHLSQ